MTFKQGCEYLNADSNRLHVQHSQNRDAHWVVEKNGRFYVDMDMYEMQRNFNIDSYTHNTNTLYWLMSQLFKTDTALSKWLADRSFKFNKQTSWQTHISSMFAVPFSNGVEPKITMHIEFFRLSMKAIAIAKKEGFNFESYS